MTGRTVVAVVGAALTVASVTAVAVGAILNPAATGNALLWIWATALAVFLVGFVGWAGQRIWRAVYGWLAER